MKKPMKPTGSGFAAFKAKAKGAAQEPDADDAKGGGLAGYLKKKAAKK